MLEINRSTVYYKAKPKSEESIKIESYVYNIWDERNNKGSRTITADLREYQGLIINRKKVQRIMRDLGIQGILPKRNLSKAGNLQYKKPYYLSGMHIYAANLVWATDITYVKLPSGMMYVICLIDVHSRFIVSYIITNTLDANGCIECFNNGVKLYNKPTILNSDQGSQFTSHEWIKKLEMQDIIISMDAKGRWADNIFMERFWRTLKYECIYILGIETVSELYTEASKYIKYYNHKRLHSALGYKTPFSVYNKSIIDNNKPHVLYCNWPPKEDMVTHSRIIVRSEVSSYVA